MNNNVTKSEFVLLTYSDIDDRIVDMMESLELEEILALNFGEHRESTRTITQPKHNCDCRHIRTNTRARSQA